MKIRNLLWCACFVLAAIPASAAAQLLSIDRASVDGSGEEPLGSSGGESLGTSAAISADGRFCAFASDATNLVSGDTGGLRDIFLRDFSSSAPNIIRLSVRNGAPANADSGRSPAGLPTSSARHVAISDDGRRVVFESLATNLDSVDTTGFSNVFLYDSTVNPATVRLISRPNLASVAIGDSYNPAISRDGNVIAFSSIAPGLFTGDDDNASLSDVLLYDTRLQDFILEKVNFGAGLQSSDGHSFDPAINRDGSMVTFTSSSTRLAARSCRTPLGEFTTTAGRNHIYLRNRGLSPFCTILVDRNRSGGESNGNSFRSSISADGRRIAFASDSSDLVQGDTNKVTDVFVAFLDANFEFSSIRRVSVGSDTSQGNGPSGIGEVSISSDGRYVTFKSQASNLLPAGGDANGTTPDIFVHDLDTGNTGIVTRSLFYQQSFTPPGNAVVNGSFIVFDSAADNLIAGTLDALSNSDVFLARLGFPLPQIITKQIRLVNPPIIFVNGRNVTAILQEFFPQKAASRRRRRPRRPAMAAAQLEEALAAEAASKAAATRGRAVRRAAKPTLRYTVTLTQSNGSVTRTNSKRNVVTINNLNPGSYTATYKAQLRRGRKVVFQTNESPGAQFDIVG